MDLEIEMSQRPLNPIFKNKYLRYHDRDSQEVIHVDYLFEGLIVRKGLGILLGMSGTGKTQLAMRIAASLATSQLIADFQVPIEVPYDFSWCTDLGATIFFVNEGKASISSRIAATESALSLKSKMELPNGQLPIMQVHGTDLRLTGSDQINDLEEAIQHKRAYYERCGFPVRLIIFDTLTASFDIEDENNNSEMQRIVTALNQFSEHFNCFVLIIAHPPKSNYKIKGYTRGASTLINSADVVFELEKIGKSKDLRQLTVTKMKDGLAEGAHATLKISTFESGPAFVLVDKNTKSKKKQTPRSPSTYLPVMRKAYWPRYRNRGVKVSLKWH